MLTRLAALDVQDILVTLWGFRLLCGLAAEPAV